MSVIAITYPLTLPSSPAPVSTDLNLGYAVADTESPFDYSVDVQDWLGRRWSGQIVLPPMTRTIADPWLVLFSKLRGRYGTILVPDWDRRSPRGTIAGTVLVKGGGQTGNGLAVDGATPATTLLAGDMISVGSRLYRCVADLTFDGSGEGTIQVEPNLRSSPADNAAVTYTNATGLFKLATNRVPNPTDFNGIASISFPIIEAL